MTSLILLGDREAMETMRPRRIARFNPIFKEQLSDQELRTLGPRKARNLAKQRIAAAKSLNQYDQGPDLQGNSSTDLSDNSNLNTDSPPPPPPNTDRRKRKKKKKKSQVTQKRTKKSFIEKNVAYIGGGVGIVLFLVGMVVIWKYKKKMKSKYRR